MSLAISSRSASRPIGLPARVELEDLEAAVDVGDVDDDLAVEAAGAQQRRVEDVGAVRRAHDDDPGVAAEAVHLDEQLVERLLALVVALADAGAALAAGGVELVDEDDRRRHLARLAEQVAHARRADADERLDELRARDARRTPRRPRRRRRGRAASCRCPAGRRAARPSARPRRASGTCSGRRGSRGSRCSSAIASRRAGDVVERDRRRALASRLRPLPVKFENEAMPPAPPSCAEPREEREQADEQQDRQQELDDDRPARLAGLLVDDDRGAAAGRGRAAPATSAASDVGVLRPRTRCRPSYGSATRAS